jgi:hypothetical protein
LKEEVAQIKAGQVDDRLIEMCQQIEEWVQCRWFEVFTALLFRIPVLLCHCCSAVCTSQTNWLYIFVPVYCVWMFGTLTLLEWRHLVPSKCWGALAQWHSITRVLKTYSVFGPEVWGSWQRQGFILLLQCAGRLWHCLIAVICRQDVALSSG